MFVYNKDYFKVPIKIWLDEDEYFNDAKVTKQTEHLAQLPFAFHHIALSPDAHTGFGMPIGGILATNNIIIPYAVGSDIGCGMCAVKTSLTDIDVDTLKKITDNIRKRIPLGSNHNKKPCSHGKMPVINETNWPRYINRNSNSIIYREYENARYQLGTLGSGNHFIEIQKGSDGHIWIMLHSGSRNLGKKVCDYYHKIAKDLNKKWYSQLPSFWELDFLPIDSDEGDAYLKEMKYCVEFALANRKELMEKVKEILTESCLDNGYELPEDDVLFEPMINIAHNYANLENHFGSNVWVHRKGATLARKGTIGIIPGSQGSSSYIVEGLGNKESFESCSHGAGRKMGRNQAKERLSLDEEIKKLNDMNVVHQLNSINRLDEAPGAYKDIDKVMENQKDLVKILVELKPIAVVKA